MYFFTKTAHLLTSFPYLFLSYLRRYLRAIVLIYFLKLTHPSLGLPQMSTCSLVLHTWSGRRWQPYMYPPPSPRADITNRSNTGLRQIAPIDGR